MANIVLIDNYDSFTYNIVQALSMLGHQLQVFLNDQCTIDQINACQPNILVLGPGPKSPEHAGNLMLILKHFQNHLPILGICLGHQAIALHFGGQVLHAPKVQHGKKDFIQHQHALFEGLSQPFQIGRYHSLQVHQLPACLIPIAYSSDGVIQAMIHQDKAIVGLQFHPESILCPQGLQLLERIFDSFAL